MEGSTKNGSFLKLPKDLFDQPHNISGGSLKDCDRDRPNCAHGKETHSPLIELSHEFAHKERNTNQGFLLQLQAANYGTLLTRPEKLIE